MITWVENKGQYATGYIAYFGKIKIGSTSRSLDRKRGEWLAHFSLPGITIMQAFTHQATEADARKIVELAATKWLTNAGLVAK